MKSVLLIFLVLCLAFSLFVIVLCPLSNFACEFVFFPFLIDLSDFFHFDVMKELSMYFIGE